ncbi:hypothetical protein L5515_019198 [Caenorhabditis briggsae]|uniref:Uncharacterized protein n=1 Tax=Caenorhabditis briggsae TaxID=6238 RepID=A0AAE9JSV8_CAEBR|nr:hypothetical protein L3Y34_013354 [Caenorhabditis briggsae]UMM43882.1 hypothetical protein L5515_019198 [Caenorhabditis briggsae]
MASAKQPFSAISTLFSIPFSTSYDLRTMWILSYRSFPPSNSRISSPYCPYILIQPTTHVLQQLSSVHPINYPLSYLDTHFSSFISFLSSFLYRIYNCIRFYYV